MTTTTSEWAYRALGHAAEQIGANNYATGTGVQVITRRRVKVRRYSPTPTHRRVINAMAEVMRGSLSPEDAMSILWEWDVMAERGWTP